MDFDRDPAWIEQPQSSVQSHEQPAYARVAVIIKHTNISILSNFHFTNNCLLICRACSPRSSGEINEMVAITERRKARKAKKNLLIYVEL